MVKNQSPTGDADSIHWSGRSPGGGSGNPLHYSCLEISMDRNLMGYSPWDLKELDKQLSMHRIRAKS